jgi:serine/threonine protein kinase
LAGGAAADFAAHLADRYHVGREVGRGAAGLVFEAQDLKHDRPVAIKLLRKEFAGSVSYTRFKREIEILARLNHPNIVALYDWGEFDGAPWYAMSFVDGESLSHRIDREGALPIDESLRIARDVAGALAQAHAAGIIHRDIKPANILIRGRDVLVADFGIARAVNRASLPAISSGGMQIGTPAYMSPEQAAAESDIDGRSDIYSLGCVLYEMLAGRSPFSGPSPAALAARHVLHPVPPLTTVRPSVTKPLEEIVECALSKARADRFATALEFAAALDAVAREPNVSVMAPPPRPNLARRLLSRLRGRRT